MLVKRARTVVSYITTGSSTISLNKVLKIKSKLQINQSSSSNQITLSSLLIRTTLLAAAFAR